jgi:hypothetical protein
MTDKQDRIEDARRRGVCPNCGAALGSERVGSGSVADGVFCSLGCLSEFDFVGGDDSGGGDS